MAEDNELHIEDLVSWLNQARTDPKSLIPFLETHLQNFRNEKQIQLSPHSYYQTFEGKKAWIEAIQFLQTQEPINQLIRHQGLNQAADDHAKDLAQNQAMGNIGSDGSTIQSRIRRYCVLDKEEVGTTVAQEFKKKVRNHARETILSLIVCDGNPGRTDRFQIFNAQFQFFGVSIQDSQTRFVTVINYSSHNLQDSRSVGGVLGNKLNSVNIPTVQSSSLKKGISMISTDSQNSFPIVRKNVQPQFRQVQSIVL